MMVLLGISLLYLLSAFADAADLTRCPENLHIASHNLRQYGSHCYEFIIDHPGDWNHANGDCKSRGGTLVDIHNSAENNFLYNTMQTLGFHHDKGIWIGLTDVEKEGQWRWSTGNDVDYKHWGKDQPGIVGAFEDCVLLQFGDQGKWHDYPCSGFLFTKQSHGWICKYDMTPKPMMPSSMPTSTIMPSSTQTVSSMKPSSQMVSSMQHSSQMVSSMKPSSQMETSHQLQSSMHPTMQMMTSSMQASNQMMTSSVQQSSQMMTSSMQQSSQMMTSSVQQSSQMMTSSMQQSSQMMTTSMQPSMQVMTSSMPNMQSKSQMMSSSALLQSSMKATTSMPVPMPTSKMSHMHMGLSSSSIVMTSSNPSQDLQSTVTQSTAMPSFSQR